MKTALRAAETAAVEGTSIEVIDARSIAPLDLAVMAKSLEKTGRLVVVQESPHTASVGSEMIAELTQRCFYSLQGAGTARERLSRAVPADANRRGLPTDGRSHPRRRGPSDGIRKLSEEIFLLPDVGEGLTEAEIVTWKVKVGDVVILNQPLVDIETAKATVELPSPYAGTVVALHGNVGDVLGSAQAPHHVRGRWYRWLATASARGAQRAGSGSRGRRTRPRARSARDARPCSSATASPTRTPSSRASTDDRVVHRRHQRPHQLQSPPLSVTASAPVATPPVAPRCTPPVRLYAKQHGVDIESLTRHRTRRPHHARRRGSGPQRRTSSTPSAPRVSRTITGPNTTSRFVGRELESWATGPKEERIPVKGVLRSMAEAMVQSAFTQPRAAVWVRVDATRTMDLVASLKEQPNLADVRLSPLTIIALAVCDAARHFPGINSSFDAADNEVIVRRSVNLGIAANTPRGLIVPNIKGADQLDLVGMALGPARCSWTRPVRGRPPRTR